jgi:Acetyltransferase (GNAT) family
MTLHPTRPATQDDVGAVAALAALRRQDCELQQPRFWRQAEDALAQHSSYLHQLVGDHEHIFLVTEDDTHLIGFAIGRLVAAPPVYDPGGPTCLIDDFAVESPDAWELAGLALLRDVSRVARDRGAVQVVVVAARHDEPKRRALTEAGLTPASEWWLGTIASA